MEGHSDGRNVGFDKAEDSCSVPKLLRNIVTMLALSM